MHTAHHSPSTTIDATIPHAIDPLVLANHEAHALRDGDVMLFISDDRHASDDLFAWAHQTGNSVLDVESLDERRSGYYIQKGQRWAPSVVLDARGQRCPTPIIEAGRRLRFLAADEVLRLISDCPAARSDVSAWCQSTGHTLLDVVRDARGVESFYIRK
ncbi:MAG: sulfurtransferase TusA family protein [Ectothiorhodospiraceae bacterium]|jgi:tRNA 2-thiouridine synthesizing protein A|nr:sulfurtransferase TusA family protein [Ectothiorhodospiraceae bacterium]